MVELMGEFQFLLVRLKVLKISINLILKNISIPFGAIKSRLWKKFAE